MLDSRHPLPSRGATSADLSDPTCGICQDWASRAFGASGVANAASGNPLALTRSLTWCPGCGDYIPAPTLT
jgi:hypothetical protein